MNELGWTGVIGVEGVGVGGGSDSEAVAAAEGALVVGTRLAGRYNGSAFALGYGCSEIKTYLSIIILRVLLLRRRL